MNTLLIKFVVLGYFAVGLNAVAAPFEWRLGDEVAKNGDVHTFCYQFHRGKIINDGNPIEPSNCSQPMPDLATYRFLKADKVAHNGDLRTLCFALNPKTNKVINDGNPVERYYCEKFVYQWKLGDSVAHNGDARTLCFEVRRGKVVNGGNPVDESSCTQPKRDLAIYRFARGDAVAHNGDLRTLCFVLNPVTWKVINGGNPVDEIYCGRPSQTSNSGVGLIGSGKIGVLQYEKNETKGACPSNWSSCPSNPSAMPQVPASARDGDIVYVGGYPYRYRER